GGGSGTRIAVKCFAIIGDFANIFARAMHRPAPVRSSRGRSIHFTGALGLREPRRRDHDRTSLLWRFTDLPSLSCWRSFLLILKLSICPASNLIIIRRSLSPVDELRNLR